MLSEMLPLVLAGVAGAALASAFWSWQMKPTPSQMELVHENTALTILAGEAMARLDADEREELEQDLNERLEAAFGPGAGAEIEEVTPDE
jgi:hypothetical protein